MPRPPASPSPPPASFPFTAGSFDYPHASSPPPPAPRSSNRNVLRLADEPPERATSDLHHVVPTAAALRRLSARRRQMMQRLMSRDGDASDNLLRRPSTANPNRSRATPSERYQPGMGAWRSAFADSPTEPFDSLSEFPVSAMLLPTTRSRSPMGDSNAERRQTKRRKLDHDPNRGSEYDNIRYGYKGQIVPGRLKMDIVSCDGGEYKKDNHAGLYNIHNVLKNDKSVYCSESSRCNLLLRHIGDAPFALEKIVIRAPDRGFTAPVQEGLVFVSMTADELLAGTAAYRLQYDGYLSPSTSPPTSDTDHDEQLSLREALEDPDVWQTSRRNEPDDVEARIERLRIRTRILNAESSLRAELDRRRTQFISADADDDVFGDNCDYIADGSYSAAAGISAPTPPPFTVTTASEDEESDSNEDLPSAAIIADRLRRESRWRPNSDDEEDEPRFGPLRRAPPLEYTSYREWRRRQDRQTEPIRAPRLGGPSRIEPSDAAANESVIQPHARFFIEKNKNKITIKFHPAISGRNVLLKFWSPTHDGNIDIESVQFYGYSGPRFFPAMQPC